MSVQPLPRSVVRSSTFHRQEREGIAYQNPNNAENRITFEVGLEDRYKITVQCIADENNTATFFLTHEYTLKVSDQKNLLKSDTKSVADRFFELCNSLGAHSAVALLQNQATVSIREFPGVIAQLKTDAERRIKESIEQEKGSQCCFCFWKKI